MDSQLLILIVIAVIASLAVGAWVYARSRTDRDADVRASDSGGASRADTAVLDAPPLRSRLARSRSALASALAGAFASGSLDADTWAEIEDALIAADVGPGVAAGIVDQVRSREPESVDEAQSMLAETIIAALDRDDRAIVLDGSPAVVVVVGVNGTGKTTSIAKLARRFTDEGRSVVLGAADTFRAAADTQLRTWGDRVGVPVVSGNEGTDPASVAYDAFRQARDRGADVVIIDTAGRLHSRSNLMDELGKIIRVLTREAGAIDEVLLVLDGTVGQNGLAQAEAFVDVAGVTGVVLTKLDGTARGGVALAVERQLDVPIKLIGVGEQMDDLIPFVPADFVDALVAP